MSHKVSFGQRRGFWIMLGTTLISNQVHWWVNSWINFWRQGLSGESKLWGHSYNRLVLLQAVPFLSLLPSVQELRLPSSSPPYASCTFHPADHRLNSLTLGAKINLFWKFVYCFFFNFLFFSSFFFFPVLKKWLIYM